jgi:hypothetical protein
MMTMTIMKRAATMRGVWIIRPSATTGALMQRERTNKVEEAEGGRTRTEAEGKKERGKRYMVDDVFLPADP